MESDLRVTVSRKKGDANLLLCNICTYFAKWFYTYGVTGVMIKKDECGKKTR